MRRIDWIDISVCVVVLVALSCGAYVVYGDQLGDAPLDAHFTPDMSLRDVARANGIPVRKILHIASHDASGAWDWPRDVPIRELPGGEEAVHHALLHAAEEQSPLRGMLRFGILGALGGGVVLLLVSVKRIGRWRTWALLGTVVVLGVALGPSPNPMEAVVKAFKVSLGMEADAVAMVLLLALFALVSVVGNKVMCGWGCHLGALQDLLYRVSPFKRLKRLRVPFWWANGVRIALFVVFLDLFFGGVLGTRDFVIYHHVNLFKVYAWDLAPIALMVLPVILVLSFGIYRPYCQFICPFGLGSWCLENVSVYRVRVDTTLCTGCRKCVAACPTEAMKARLDSKRSVFLPDCWACGACIEACPEGAIRFDRPGGVRLPETPSS